MRANRRYVEHLTDALSGERIDTAELVEPGSILQDVMGDGVTYLYSGLAILVLGTVQKQVIQGLKDHEAIFKKMYDPSLPKVSSQEMSRYGVTRIKESVELVGGIVFGTSKRDRADAAYALRELHRKIQGEMEDGSRYHAWEPELWARAWSGIFKGLIESYDNFRGLTDDERENLLKGFVELRRLFCVRGIPDTWADYQRYWSEFMGQAVVD